MIDIDTVLFLLAFFSFIWILMMSSASFYISNYGAEKKATEKRYQLIRAGKGFLNKCDTCLFVIFNAYILFKVQGLIVSLFFILLFINYEWFFEWLLVLAM